MEEANVAQNAGSLGLSQAEAQDLLANSMNIIAVHVQPYCWKLGGEDDDSLHNLLEITRSEMDGILRLCGVYGPSDNRVKLRIFEDFALKMSKPNIDWQMYRPMNSTSRTPFIRMGNPAIVDDGRDNCSLKGSDQYNKDGRLELIPSLHNKLSIKPRELRKNMSILLSVLVTNTNKERSRGQDRDDDETSNNVPSTPGRSATASAVVTPTDRLVKFVVGQMKSVAKTCGNKGDYNVSTWAERHVRKSVTAMTGTGECPRIKAGAGVSYASFAGKDLPRYRLILQNMKPPRSKSQIQRGLPMRLGGRWTH